ncbi:hypothetical protein OY671_008110, partial [Metschnikowia pulcherrima]
MMDAAAREAGRDNFTSADDATAALCWSSRDGMSPAPSRTFALDSSADQRERAHFGAASPAPAHSASKAGQLPGSRHDAGILTVADRSVVSAVLADGFTDWQTAHTLQGGEGAASSGQIARASDGEYHDTRHGPSAATPDDPPASHGRGFGMGPRVPMSVVSPWSRGGWVNSQVFDHTSVIRFLEARFGVAEPNISAWRRAVAGDSTSAFDFAGDRASQHADSVRHACASPYASEAVGRMTADGEHYRSTFRNAGSVGAVSHVYDRRASAHAPRRYTVGAGARSDDGWRSDAD